MHPQSKSKTRGLQSDAPQTAPRITSAPKQKLVIIVPYRDRAQNLRDFVPAITEHLDHHHPDLDYSINVIEQAGNGTWNKGRLINSGFSLLRDKGDYFCIHDVDLVPEGPQCDYSIPEHNPVHLSVFTEQSHYRGTYRDHCGGVLIARKEHFERVNGFSNEYWGWGAEDDDFGLRLRKYRIRVSQGRPGRYLSLPHERQAEALDPNLVAYKRNVDRLNSGYDYTTDGLSTLQFKLRERRDQPGYRHYLVDIGEPAPGTFAHHSYAAQPAPQTVVPAPQATRSTRTKWRRVARG